MRKKLSISQPTVINTELAPLDDNFWLEANGETEQWLYENTGEYKPNRTVTPLIITPMIKAVDTVSNISYTPVYYFVNWYVKSYVNGEWVDTLVTATTSTQPNAPYVKSGDNLIVNANNSDPTHGIVIRCEASYIDPRDIGRTYLVQSQIELTTNLDASVTYPTIQILSPSTISFNPLVSETSEIEILAQADWSHVASGSGQNAVFEWYSIDSSGNEALIDEFIFYVSGQHSGTLVVDALYGENIPIILRIKESALSEDVLPPKVFCNITWQVPNLNGIVVSENGSAVRSDSKEFTFHTIVNTNNGQLGEEIIQQNLRFKWNMRRATPMPDGSDTIIDDYGYRGALVINLGWGYKITVPASSLLYSTTSGNASKLVSNDIYILGAYDVVTYNDEVVTYNNQEVFART